MARGNWRSGKDHGVAEVGSYRKIIDGWAFKKSGTFSTKGEAHAAAVRLRRMKYLARVTPGRKGWNVWRTIRTVETMVRMKTQ